MLVPLTYVARKLQENFERATRAGGQWGQSRPSLVKASILARGRGRGTQAIGRGDHGPMKSRIELRERSNKNSEQRRRPATRQARLGMLQANAGKQSPLTGLLQRALGGEPSGRGAVGWTRNPSTTSSWDPSLWRWTRSAFQARTWVAAARPVSEIGWSGAPWRC